MSKIWISKNKRNMVAKSEGKGKDQMKVKY